MFSKYFTVKNTNGMNNAEKFRYNAKMAVEGLAVNYASVSQPLASA